MMKLLCEENNLEYTGGGYLQCGRHVDCPKKKNIKVLGFDCIVYIDNLPEGCKIDIPEDTKDIKMNIPEEPIKEDIKIDIAGTQIKSEIPIGEKAEKHINKMTKMIDILA